MSGRNRLELVSMILLVDAGNTRIKWTWLSDQGLTPMQAAVYEASAPWTQNMADSQHRPQRILVANVRGPSFAAEFATFTQSAFGVTPEYPEAQPTQLGVTNGYRQPASLGIDRWLALLAARQEDAGPCLLVGGGTALTIDALSANGLHLGGLIVPGLKMLSDLQASQPSQALAALILQSLDVLQAREPTTAPRLLLAGGDAQTLAPLLGRPVDLRQDLVLRGLSLLALSPLDPRAQTTAA